MATPVDYGVPPSEEVLAAEEAAAAAGLGISAPELLPVVIILGMMYAVTAWLHPLLNAQTHKGHSWLGRIEAWAEKKLQRGLRYVTNRVEHAMSHWVQPKLHPVVHTINSGAKELHELALAIGGLADATHEAFTYLRHKVIPELITDALAPIRIQIRRIETVLLPAMQTQLHALQVRVNQFIATVHTQLQTIHTEIRAVERQVATVTRTATRTATDLYQDVYPRLAKVEQALAPAAIAAAIAAALATSFAYLTCRNTKTAGNALCLMDEALLADALALLAGAFILSDLRTYVRIMQEITEGTTVLVHDLLQV